MRLFIAFLLSISAFAYAQPNFPLLTGRVVDNANLLSAISRSQLTQLLAQHEAETSNQVVVLTIESLDDYDISDYGYRLGRYWQLGQEGKDNGALLIVAKQDRKIRIEVGYGLEGALTDALSSQIIRNEISPLFKQGQFEQGINAGVQSMLQAIQGEYLPEPSNKGANSDLDKIMPFVMFGAFGGQMLSPMLGIRRKKKRDVQSLALLSGGTGAATGLIGGFILQSVQLGLFAGLGAAILSLLFFNNGGGGRGRGMPGGHPSGRWRGRGGGGFGGGGGSFGGGGASGGW